MTCNCIEWTLKGVMEQRNMQSTNVRVILGCFYLLSVVLCGGMHVMNSIKPPSAFHIKINLHFNHLEEKFLYMKEGCLYLFRHMFY